MASMREQFCRIADGVEVVLKDILNDPGVYFDNLIAFLDRVMKFPRAVLGLVRVELRRLENMRAKNVELRCQHRSLSQEVNEMGKKVIDYIEIVKFLRKIADDNQRKQRILDEIERQDGHFDDTCTSRFPELIDFLKDLKTRIGRVEKLYTKVVELYKNLHDKSAKATIESQERENGAWRLKFLFGALALGAATGGVGLAVLATGAAAGAALGVGGAGAYGAYTVSKKFSQEEKEFREAKEKFDQLNKGVNDLRIVADSVERKRSGVAVKLIMDSSFIREDGSKPVLTQLSKSLDELFNKLSSADIDLDGEKEEAERIIKSFH